jgi:hypothetical protein
VFAFTGPAINRDIMKDKIRTVAVGVLDGDTKYCSMRMFQSSGRRETNLKNIISQYNRLCGADERINLVAVAGFPLILADKKFPGNPISLKLATDRSTKPLGYSQWTNN